MATAMTTAGPEIRGRRIPVSGRMLHLLEAGDASGDPDAVPLLLLHGTGVDSAGLSFAPSLSALARGRRVLALDWPGYGRSDAPDAPLATADLSQLLRDLLDVLELERVHLLGFSMGASAGLQVASWQPERVSRLILVSPYGLGGKQHLPLMPYLALRAPGVARTTLRLVRDRRWALRAFLRAGVTVGGPTLPDEVLDEVQDGLRRHGPSPAFVDWLRSELRPLRHLTNLLPELPRLRAPTLLLHGQRDILVPAWRSLRAARRIPCSRLEILPCGHWLPRERREDVERLVGAWLEDPSPCRDADPYRPRYARLISGSPLRSAAGPDVTSLPFSST